MDKEALPPSTALRISRTNAVFGMNIGNVPEK
jgi:hypothetical protein